MTTEPPALRRVGRNAAVQIAGRAGSALLGLALTAALARALPVDAFGSLTTALAIAGMLAVLHDPGASEIAVRTIARDPAATGPLLGRVATARMLLVLPLAAAGAAALALTGEAGPFLAFAVAAFALSLAGRSIETVDVVFRAAQRMGRSVAAGLAGRGGHLALVLVLLAAGADRPGPFLLAAVGGTAISAALRVRLARPWVRLRPRTDLASLRPFARQALPAGATAILMALYLHADAPIVRGLAGAREAGLYNAPYRLFLLGASLPGLVMVSASPVLAARWVEDRAEFGRVARRLLALSTAAAVPVAVAVVATAPWLLSALLGPDFAAGAPSLRWLAMAAAATGPGTVATAGLVAGDRAGVAARLAASALVANVALDLMLVPSLGGRGAAIATAATETGVAAVGAWLLLRGAR